MVGGAHLSFGGFRLDLANQCVWRRDEALELTPKLFGVLSLLASRPGQLVTKDELLDTVWPGVTVSDAALKVVVSELRKLLGDDAQTPRYIATVHRRGYRFVGTVAAAVPSSETIAGATPTDSTPPAGTAVSLLVGRDAALGQLGAAFERAGRGERQSLFISGEPGIGKTALLDGFLSRLAAGARGTPTAGGTTPCLVASGQCVRHFGDFEPYLPILDALGRLCRGASAAAVTASLRRNAPTWFAQMPWLLSDADRQQLERERRGVTRERMLREFAAAVEALATDTVVVLAIEDLHWADPSTIDLLSFIAQRDDPARLLVIGTYRSVEAIVGNHPVRALAQTLQTQRRGEEIPLWYLTEPDTAALLETRLGGRLDSGVGSGIHRHTGGNPLFVCNLIEDLKRRGVLQQRNGRWAFSVADDALAAEAPEGLRQTIEQQVDQLAAGEVAALEAAAVIGVEFPAEAVAAALAIAPETAVECFERLSRTRHLVRPKDADAHTSGRFAFPHALYSSTLYRRIADAGRRRMHQRVGIWLEAQGTTPPSHLAHHFLQSGTSADCSRAATYSVRAAELAERVFAFGEAARHYELALQAMTRAAQPDERRRGIILIALGEARERVGALPLAAEAFHAAIEVARRIGASEMFAEAVMALGRGFQRLDTVNTPLIELLEEALQRLGTGDGIWRARVLSRLDWALCTVPGTQQRRAPLAREALDIARRLDDPETLLVVMQYTRWAFGEHQPADARAIEELGALLHRLDGKEQQLTVHALRVAAFLDAGDMASVDEESKTYLALVDETRIPWFAWFALRFQTARALQEGRLDDARRLADETLAAGQRMDHPNVLPYYGLHQAMLQILEGRFAELEAGLLGVIDHTAGRRAGALLAFVYSAQDKTAAAHEEFERFARDDFAGVPQDGQWLLTLSLLAQVCARLGDVPRAALLHDLLFPYDDRFIGLVSSTLPFGHASRYLGLLAVVMGRTAQARAYFERAISENERIGARPWLAFSQYDYAMLLLKRGRRADEREAKRLLGSALQTAREIGMQGLVQAAGNATA
jgi:DNA-binding winged helix-turn-helix (wHTH) protein/tetratricopeptide (TPR) repeat protein